VLYITREVWDLSVKGSSVIILAAAALTAALVVTASGADPQSKKTQKRAAKPTAAKSTAKPAGGTADVASLIEAGKKVYAANGCAGCHAIGGKGGTAGPDLSKTGANPAHTEPWFEVQIANPKAHTPTSTMPAFEATIKGKDRTALAVYMTSLGGTAKAPGAAAATTGGTASSTPGAVKVAPQNPATVAKIEKAGGSVREIAQNDNRVEVDFHMAGPTVNDAALVPLSTMKNVLELNLAKTGISDAGLAHVKGLTDLTALHLEGTKITDRGLANLAGMKNLTYLNLYSTQVTDAGLTSLSGLKNLKNVYVWQTKVTTDGAAKLKTALPNVNVVMGWDTAAAPPKPEEKKPEVKK
jgi:mono/diheme cytochrome c family protein